MMYMYFSCVNDFSGKMDFFDSTYPKDEDKHLNVP